MAILGGPKLIAFTVPVSIQVYAELDAIGAYAAEGKARRILSVCVSEGGAKQSKPSRKCRTQATIFFSPSFSQV